MEVAGCRLLVAEARGEGGVFRTPFRRLSGLQACARNLRGARGTPQKRSLLAFEAPPEPEVAGLQADRNSGGEGCLCRPIGGTIGVAAGLQARWPEPLIGSKSSQTFFFGTVRWWRGGCHHVGAWYPPTLLRLGGGVPLSTQSVRATATTAFVPYNSF